MLAETHSQTRARVGREIPGDPGWPLVGHLFNYIRDPIRWIESRRARFGNLSWTAFFGMRIVLMLGADANRFVLQDREKVFSSKQGWDYYIGKFFGRSLMLRDFDDHYAHRKIMQMAFTRPALVGYLEQMNPEIERALAEWPSGGKLRVYPMVKKLTLDLASKVFLGQDLGPKAERLNRAFIDAVRGGGAAIRFPVPGLRWWKGLRGRKHLEEFFYAAIPEKRAGQAADLFSQLCRAETEEGERYSDRDVVDHMIFLLMAAHDTTTITLTSMFNHLSQHPKWQERLRKESKALDKEWVSYDDMNELPGLGLAMKECLRLCPPVPGLPRKTLRDIEFEGYHIPKGTMVNIQLFFTHLMEEYWKDPMTFDPERFSEGRAEHKVDPYAWVPFGGGAHKCIGLTFAEFQVKAVMHQILKRYRWHVPEGYRMPMDWSSLPKPKDDLPVTLERL